MEFSRFFTLILFLLISLDKGRVEQNSPVKFDQFEAIYGSKGVLVYMNAGRNYRKNIMLFNSDGTVFATISTEKHLIKFGKYKFGLSGAELSDAMLDKKYQFNPQEFYPDYGVIIFAYKSIRNGKAEVYIDKEKKNTKFIKIDPTLFNVESWKTHLTGAIPGIDNLKNPLREKPNDSISTKQIKVPDDAIFRIINFKGYWTQVECFSFCESTCGKKYRGWIRWTDGKQPLLKLYYVC